MWVIVLSIYIQSKRFIIQCYKSNRKRRVESDIIGKHRQPVVPFIIIWRSDFPINSPLLYRRWRLSLISLLLFRRCGLFLWSWHSNLISDIWYLKHLNIEDCTIIKLNSNSFCRISIISILIKKALCSYSDLLWCSCIYYTYELSS